ncbi:MAG: cysteine--tRNA ligase [bacterium]
MTLKIYSTLSRTKDEFVPIEPGHVRMYVCGPTVYDSAHLGHARSALTFDVVRRYLQYLGYEVRLVRNLTDVDDKIIQRAQRDGVAWHEIARRYTDEYNRDMQDLGLIPPTVEPRATDHIADMQALIGELVARGAAYVVDGDVFFSVAAFPSYGRLSGQDVDQVRAGSRIDVDERKRAAEDFALWKSVKPGEPSWPSPWGPGRPGWHIECSAMAATQLGVPFDIHGGGSDLIFPHHENEIAQSEAASGEPFARVWMHNGMIRVNQEKMSKSLGNFSTIRDLLALHDAETIRLFLLSQHYRSPVDFSLDGIEESRKALARGYATMARVDREDWGAAPKGAKAKPDAGSDPEPALQSWDALETQFREAMDDDFNTARAIGVLFEGVRLINRLADQARGAKGEANQVAAREGRAHLARLGEILGVFVSSPPAWLERDRDRRALRLGLGTEWVEERIRARAQARVEKRWADADAIRDELARRGVVLEDRPGGVTDWSVVEAQPASEP